MRPWDAALDRHVPACPCYQHGLHRPKPGDTRLRLASPFRPASPSLVQGRPRRTAYFERRSKERSDFEDRSPHTCTNHTAWTSRLAGMFLTIVCRGCVRGWRPVRRGLPTASRTSGGQRLARGPATRVGTTRPSRLADPRRPKVGRQGVWVELPSAPDDLRRGLAAFDAGPLDGGDSLELGYAGAPQPRVGDQRAYEPCRG
jgi:hypothetical protein